jgi:hypothetical protein
MSVAEAILWLAAELPDPGAALFPALCGSYGGFVCGLAGWLGRRPIGPLVAGGTVLGFGVGLLSWLAALAIDRL